MNELTIKTVRVAVRGRVQGVAFRDWTRREAAGLAVSGWVRNEPDGSVSALLSGAPEAVDRMIERLHVGPPAARVQEVAIVSADDEAPASGFAILR